MTDLTFAQQSRRNYAVPILIAVAVVGLIGGLCYRFLPRHTIAIAVTNATVYPIRVVYKQQQNAEFKLLNQPKEQPQEQGVYVIATLHVDNHLADPLFLKDFTAVLTTSDGELRTSAIEKQDLETVYSAFPEITPLMSTPLLRETTVARGQSAEGTILLQFPIRQATWEQRKSATVTIDFYHQPSITIPIPPRQTKHLP